MRQIAIPDFERAQFAEARHKAIDAIGCADIVHDQAGDMTKIRRQGRQGLQNGPQPRLFEFQHLPQITVADDMPGPHSTPGFLQEITYRMPVTEYYPFAVPRNTTRPRHFPVNRRNNPSIKRALQLV